MGKPKSSEVAQTAPGPDIKRMSRILIADDDRELCALLADYLRREGFEVDTVHDGEATLAHLREASLRPELLILDVMMPAATAWKRCANCASSIACR